MIEIYCGDGKGKTTAAVGLALRAAGNKIPVLLIQFMKDGSSGEVQMLKKLEGVSVYYPKTFYGFADTMNEQQKEEMRGQYQELLSMAAEAMEKQKVMHQEEQIGLLLILDEVIHACNKNLLEEQVLLKLVKECPDNTELVLTGRNPSSELLKMADYITEMKKRRHPFDKGIPARKGIERCKMTIWQDLKRCCRRRLKRKALKLFQRS